MAIHLVCVSETLGHKRGDLITDPDAVAQYLASDVENHFVKRAVPDEPAPPAPAAD